MIFFIYYQQELLSVYKKQSFNTTEQTSNISLAKVQQTGLMVQNKAKQISHWFKLFRHSMLVTAVTLYFVFKSETQV